MLMEKLAKQSMIDRTEIIIVDSGSTDTTIQNALQYGAFIHKIHQYEFNHGMTRNLGASLGTGSFICFLTQDAIPADEYLLEKMVQTVQVYNVAGCYACQVPRPSASPLVSRDLTQWLSGSGTQQIHSVTSMSDFLTQTPIDKYCYCAFDNVASMIKREIWEKIPFPSTPFGEDIEWAFRVLCNGYTIVYEPGAVVEHSHERSSTYLYKRTYVDHYRLNELFGIRTIPGMQYAVKSMIQTSLADWIYLMRNFRPSLQWLYWMKDVPFNAWASAWGQYQGAKAASEGLPVFQSKDV